MILITKPAAPTKLSEGNPLTCGRCAAFVANPVRYRSGTAKFDISSTIYNDEAVKDVLREAHYKKCCFCEGKFEANAAADVEHYRPKGFSQQGCKEPKIYPGYYWLIYDWNNLFYCCQDCNRYNKRNYFPLRNPNSRARSHLQSIAAEEPLILNPGGPENPRDHILFHGEIAVGRTDAGNSTVDFLGLNRPLLTEDRLGHLAKLKFFYDVVRVFGNSLGVEKREVVADARAKIDAAMRQEAKFSAMASDFYG